ncbi:UDP-glucose 4-epimerase GalE [Halobacteriovorax marinus]|uniref:UDP-glucose 4-epimerase n=1 Tax=Halobacteriovorax marinus TaxID=97084 RepID=A0A1Y5FHT3_9BACT|nr:UDP-glucose 4-epimerase GalE [Halobacteriovorax marinus]
MAKILVTGGAGYIGSHIVNLLGSSDHDIIIYDNLSTGREKSVLAGELVIGDLEDHAKLDALMKEHNFSACFHFAGSIIVPESVTDPLKYYNNNTQNTLDLINLCVKNKINKFIFSSTAAVYGMAPGGVCSEEMQVQPINPYGRTKLMTEWMLEDVAHAHDDFNFVILRYFNVAGANIEGKVGQCSPLSTHLIKIACETALGKRDKMFVFGDDYETKDGTCIRDYIHVDDLAQAHIDALTYLLKGGESTLCNCGYGHGFTVKEVLEVVKKVSGVDFKIEMGPRRAGDAPVLMSKAEKIGKVLGWTPKHDDLELIVRTAFEWEKNLKD